MNDDDIYLHFRQQYKIAVMELDKKYGEHYSYVKRMQEDIAILKAEVEMLKGD